MTKTVKILLIILGLATVSIFSFRAFQGPKLANKIEITSDIISEKSLNYINPSELKKGEYIELNTNYHSFIIRNDIGQESIVEGINSSGNINIYFGYSGIGACEDGPCSDGVDNNYYINKKANYTIIPLDKQKVYSTSFHANLDGGEGSYIRVESKNKEGVWVSPSGEVMIISDGGRNTRISSTINSTITPWYTLEIEGKIGPIKLTPLPDKSIIQSLSGPIGEIRIKGLDDRNEYSIDGSFDEEIVIVKNIDLSSRGLSKENFGITNFNGDILKTIPLTYSVLFRTHRGYPSVDMITGVKYNEKIDEPKDINPDEWGLKGWCKDPLCKEHWDFKKDRVTQNTTLHADWGENYE
jgi:hypothetical protein